MTPAEFIACAIDRGARSGLAATSGLERIVFLISEAEVLCDMEGICWFIDYIEPDVVREMSSAFKTIGATEIASGLLSIALEGDAVSDDILRRTGDLICERSGYDYESIHAYVESELSRGNQS